MLSVAHHLRAWRQALQYGLLRIYAWFLDTDTSEAMPPPPRVLIGYGAALAGITIATVIIGFIQGIARVENISLVYLLVVLWLALFYGRGPSVLAAFLSFLAYDYFFVPPIHLLSVGDPAEWLSLATLLLTALVVGQLTAEVRRRERHAIASEQRIATLYDLAQAIAAGTEQDRLLEVLTQRTAREFAPAGVVACALFLPDASSQHLRPRAIAQATSTLQNTNHLDAPEHLAHAETAWHDSCTSALVTERQDDSALLTFFIPLVSGQHTVGVLSISGTPAIATLVAGSRLRAGESSSQMNLLIAFCDQLALALERESLQQETIHVAALRESDRLKDALLSSVTHDLQTPLAAIRVATSSLMQTDITWDETDRTEIVAAIDSSASRLSRLVDNLLTLSRLEAGVAMPATSLYPINDIIATILDQSDRAGMTVGRTITVDLGDETLLAPMDHAQIERVMQNLLDNALKYSPPRSPIVIHAERDSANKMLQVAITDQGLGIPLDKLSAIFDKFYRIQQNESPWGGERPPVGTGLGLAICAGIIRDHGGRIWAESTPGQGATFTFTLPLHASPLATSTIESQEARR